MTKHFLLFFTSALSSQAIVLISDTIVVANPPQTELGSNIFDFDVNNDGEIDWSIKSQTQVFGSNGVNAIAASTTGFIYQTLSIGGFPLVNPLDSGTQIGSLLPGPTYSWFHGFDSPLSSLANFQTFGPFYLMKGYLGFEFQADDGTHYGYAYLESLGTSSMRISQVAWETEPGKSIRAGNVPEPSTSLLLVLSICTVVSLRKRI